MEVGNGASLKGVEWGKMMMYKEIHRDLFSVDFTRYHPAHCIASDCVMGAGIAVPMKKKFKLGGLIQAGPELLKHPTCVLHHGVYNLITKKKSSGKPTLLSLEIALCKMRQQVIKNEHKFIVMPRIGSGLDGLSWPRVREIIKDIFKDVDVVILVCFI